MKPRPPVPAWVSLLSLLCPVHRLMEMLLQPFRGGATVPHSRPPWDLGHPPEDGPLKRCS